MKYLIGFDCGATKTECAVANNDGKILKSKTGGPANLLVTGIDRVSEIILALIYELKDELEFKYKDINSIVIGAAGAGRVSDASRLYDKLTEKFDKKGISLKSFKVLSDAQITLEGAFPKKPGCILIAGTGSIIYGKDDKGNFYRVGGFGRIIGDEGSGYSIGRMALQLFSKYLDGRSGKSTLTELIAHTYNVHNLDELVTKVYNENLDIAKLAEIVINAAEEGDLEAMNILEKESDELLLLIKSLINKINIKELPVAFGGSLLTNPNYYSNLLKKKIHSSFPSVKIVKPMLTPVEGAILLAKEMLND